MHDSNDSYAINVRIEKAKEDIAPNTWAGEIEVLRDGIIAATVDFYITDAEIYISDFTVVENYEHKGYGKVMMALMKTFARVYEKPIILYSIKEACGFYIRTGFLPLSHKKFKERLKIKPVLASKLSEYDLIWIPETIHKNKILEVFF